jgi:glycogen synthase kinase 3 beta
MFIYNPKKRLKPLAGLLHPFFNDLRAKNCKINGRSIPNLFNFTEGYC